MFAYCDIDLKRSSGCDRAGAIARTLTLLLACLPGVVAAQTAVAPAPPAAPASAPSPRPVPLSWSVTEGTTPLSGAPLVTAILESTQPLINMIGQPQHASLVLRCQEGVLATYVSWPEVLQMNGTTFGGRPQTMVLWSLDSQPIAASFWLRDTSGTATGMFDTKAAVKFLEKLIVARRFVVRLTGQTTQDAVFELGDIETVAGKVGASCGVKWTLPR